MSGSGEREPLVSPGTRNLPGDEYGYERDEAAPAELPGRRPRPGQDVIVTMGLAIGLLLMALQLWLLTLAFDLYLAGKRADTLSVAFFSGLVFLGGIVMLLLIERRPSR